MGKRWLTGGPEDQYLLKLLKEGKITIYDKPGSVQDSYEMFSGFSKDTFRRKFLEAKQHHRNGTTPRFNAEFDDVSMQSMPEIDGEPQPSCSYEPAKKKLKLTPLQHSNYPILSGSFMDAKSKQKKVIVAIPMLNGPVEIDVNIEEGDCGRSLLKVTYNWPPIMSNTKAMFSNEKGKLIIDENSPALLCLEESLKRVKTNIEEVPEASISYELPEAVCSDPRDWEITYNKNKEGTVGLLTFLCKDNEYVIQKSKKTLKIS